MTAGGYLVSVARRRCSAVSLVEGVWHDKSDMLDVAYSNVRTHFVTLQYQVPGSTVSPRRESKDAPFDTRQYKLTKNAFFVKLNPVSGKWYPETSENPIYIQ